MSSIEIFFDSACFLKFSPITKQLDAPKHHDLGLLSSYEIMSLANFEIFYKQEIWKLDTLT